MTDAQRGVAPRQFSWADLLLRWGVLLVIVGLVGGLAAKSFADRASYGASQATRLIGIDSSNPSVLAPDASSAHYVPPDYTVFWIGMLVVALGLIVVVAGIGVALAKRRAA
jgi:hypothetical protein